MQASRMRSTRWKLPATISVTIAAAARVDAHRDGDASAPGRGGDAGELRARRAEVRNHSAVVRRGCFALRLAGDSDPMRASTPAPAW